jgi:surface polysaccharide O-acyltransferase-like enzyme
MPEIGEPATSQMARGGIANPAIRETPAANKGRVLAIDTARFLAIFAVICVHTRPFGSDHLPGYSPHWHLLYSVISIGSRSAVPFFFCISGYFWGRRVRSGTSAKAISVKMLERLTAVFLLWIAVYFLLNNLLLIAQPWVPMELGADATQRISIMWHPLRMLHGGAAEPLWFLPALFCAVALKWLFVTYGRSDILIAFALALYVIGVSARAYSHSSIGLNLSLLGRHIDTRDGPFFGALFFVTGYLISKHLPRPQWAHWVLAFFWLRAYPCMRSSYLLFTRSCTLSWSRTTFRDMSSPLMLRGSVRPCWPWLVHVGYLMRRLLGGDTARLVSIVSTRPSAGYSQAQLL